MEIALLKKENESDKYIKDYIIRANDLIEFFSNWMKNIYINIWI